jgi:hypothetical protein
MDIPETDDMNKPLTPEENTLEGVNKETEVNESSLVEDETIPSPLNKNFSGETVSKPLETPLESTNKPSLQQGGKSKRRRRTIRKSKKQPKYRYVY